MRPRFLASVLVAMMVLTGCRLPENKLFVRNETEEVWFVRAPFGHGYTDRFQVQRVEPHAEGVALGWDGALGFEIELLNSECTKVGTFESVDGVTYTVVGVAGLTGTVSPYTYADNWNDPDVFIVTECGGSVFAHAQPENALFADKVSTKVSVGFEDLSRRGVGSGFHARFGGADARI